MHLLKTVVSLTTVILVTACSSTPTLNDNVPIKSNLASTTADARTVSTVNAVNVGNDGSPELSDPKSILAKRNVYFDLDSYMVRQEYAPLVSAHSKFLVQNNPRKIIIQGHTDERGGSEYNLALGQKRAEAVRRSLSLLGVQNAQMETISFGKEKPISLGSDEDAYAKNRRAELVYSYGQPAR